MPVKFSEEQIQGAAEILRKEESRFERFAMQHIRGIKVAEELGIGRNLFSVAFPLAYNETWKEYSLRIRAKKNMEDSQAFIEERRQRKRIDPYERTKHKSDY